MLNFPLASPASKAGRLRLCLWFALCIAFVNASGVTSAQNFVGEVVQQNAVPVMQQSGEVIIEYYYPVVEQDFFVPLPQESVYLPPQIGFPTPQPRFLPAGPLYIDPTPLPAPQSNIYGEVIIGEFEELAPQITKPETNPPEQKVVDQNNANQPSPSAQSNSQPKTEGAAQDNAESKPDKLAERRSEGSEKIAGDAPKMPPQKDLPAPQNKDAAAENKTPDAQDNTDPRDTSSEPAVAGDSNQSTEPDIGDKAGSIADGQKQNPDPAIDPTAEAKADQEVAKASNKTPSGSQTKQLADQTENKSAMASADPRRSDSFMDPLGPIAEDQKTHLFWVTVLTMVAIVPVFILLPLILFKYRRGRKQQETYQPKWDSSSILEILMWGVPVVLVTFMSARLWHSTHVLDPYAEITSKKPTVNVQVVGLDWKWLFIYPDHGIATVGEFNMPVEQPVSMTLTTDTVMQSFAIPALAGQIYAMPGMTTKLNLIADQLGSMEGENTQFNGDGFAEQKFMTHVVSADDFEAWVEKVKQNSVPLDQQSYKTLAQRTRQSKAVADLATDGMPAGVVYFTLDDEQFFMNIMMRYMNHKPLKDEDQPGSPEYGVPVDTVETSLRTGDDQ